MQLGYLVTAKQSPVFPRLHAFHEEVGNPIGGVHVVCAPPFVSCVSTQFEKVENIVMPRLEIGTTRPLALAALVDGAKLIVVHLEKGNHALAVTISTLDIATCPAHGGPTSSHAACPFRQESIFGNASIHDGFDGVVYLV